VYLHLGNQRPASPLHYGVYDDGGGMGGMRGAGYVGGDYVLLRSAAT
jgi:hypothetical protein